MYRTFTTDNEDGSKTKTTYISGPGMRIKIKETTFEEPETKENFDDVFDRIQIKKVDKKKPKVESKNYELNELREELYKKAEEDGAIDNLKEISSKYDKDELQEITKALPSLISNPDFVSKILDAIVEGYRKNKKEE